MGVKMTELSESKNTEAAALGSGPLRRGDRPLTASRTEARQSMYAEKALARRY